MVIVVGDRLGCSAGVCVCKSERTRTRSNQTIGRTMEAQ